MKLKIKEFYKETSYNLSVVKCIGSGFYKPQFHVVCKFRTGIKYLTQEGWQSGCSSSPLYTEKEANEVIANGLKDFPQAKAVLNETLY